MQTKSALYYGIVWWNDGKHDVHEELFLSIFFAVQFIYKFSNFMLFIFIFSIIYGK